MSEIRKKRHNLGCLPRKAKVGSVFPVFGSGNTPTIIPKKDWKPIDFSHLVPEILDQDGTNACNAFAATQTIHVIRAEAGLPYVKLSAGNLYGRINGGVDAGSYLSDAIAELLKNGVCRADLVPELQWRQRNWPSNWKEDARKFKALEAWDCPTFDHIASALQYGFPCDIGVNFSGTFDTNSDGWVPYRPARGGHAMCAVGLIYHDKYGWGVKVANSWGKNWGVNGFGILPEEFFTKSVFSDGWAVRGVVDPEGEE